jgi:PrsW family intramembrane metalloprotease
MILAIIFAQVWGVIQLIVLTSLARTVRVRTVLAAMAVGFYAIGPVTAFIQLSWIRIAAHVFGKAVFDLTGVASYTVDPFIEEAMKLLPLLVLLLIPAIRRQWSVTDCLLIAAATGSGFGLAEHLFRYADYASTAQSVSGGYALTIGSATPLVPGIARTLTSWIPLGVFFESNAVRVNWHLAWSAIGGLAVGLFLRNRKKWARPTAIGLLVLICLNHAAGNAASIQYTWLSPLAASMRFLDSLLAFLVLVAVAVAWWLDQPLQRAGMALGPLLAAEQSAPSRLAGTFTAAFSRLPWSIPWVLGFDRARRAYHAARASSPDTVDDMRDAIVAERDSVDRKLAQPGAPPLLPPAWMPSNVGTTVRRALRSPSVIIWLVLIAPSMLYLIIGGFPATSGLQAVMKGPIVWPVVLLITLVGRGRSAWRVLASIRTLPAMTRRPIGDDAAMLGLQVASGLGTLSLASFTFARVLSGVGAGERMLSSAHAADAINRTQPAGGTAIAGSAGAFDPPPSSPALPGDAAATAPGAAAGDGARSAAGDSPTSKGSSGDSSNSDDRPGHEIPMNEPRAGSGSTPNAGPASDSPGAAEPGYAETSVAQPALGMAASSIGGAFDPPPPSLDLPDAQPAAEGPAEVPQPDSSKRIQAGYAQKDHYDSLGSNEGAADGVSSGETTPTPPPPGGAAPSSAGAFDPPPPSLELPDAHPVAAQSPAAPEPPATDVSSSDTSADDGSAPDTSGGETPQPDSSKRIQAGYEKMGHYDYVGENEGATDAAPPTAAKAAAPGGGAFDAPPPSVELPQDASTTSRSPLSAVKADAQAAGENVADGVPQPKSMSAPETSPPSVSEPDVDATTAGTLQPTMTHVSQADIDAALKRTPAATMSPATQAEIAAAAAKAAAARTPVASPAPVPASGGGAFDAPPPSVELPHPAAATDSGSAAPSAANATKGGGKSGTVPPRKKP